jgi:putative FmdB family regulatory protein
MPIYEYRCSDCNHQLEVIQKISEQPMRFCPECGKESLQKQVTAAGFRLKGGGWYETDFKTDKDKKKNLASSDNTAASSSSESKSETKSAPAKVETNSD